MNFWVDSGDSIAVLWMAGIGTAPDTTVAIFWLKNRRPDK
jgi:hypothetical protein